jgi:hypothetical protein
MMLGDSFNPYIGWDEQGNRVEHFEIKTGAPGAQGATGRRGGQGPTGPSSKDAKGGLKVAVLPNSVAERSTIYYSLEEQRLVFKDYRGVICVLTERKPPDKKFKEELIGPQI